MANNTIRDTGRDTLDTMAAVQVSGTVSSTTGETLPGAHVYYIGSDGQAVGTVTDANGAFSMTAREGVTLRATFVGYTGQEVSITAASSPVAFVLAPGVDIPEFEVVGEGSGNMGALAIGGLLLLLVLSGDR